MANYVVSADVGKRDIEWEFDYGQTAMRFWRQLKETGRTPDTDQPVLTATLLRAGRLVEKFKAPDTSHTERNSTQDG